MTDLFPGLKLKNTDISDEDLRLLTYLNISEVKEEYLPDATDAWKCKCPTNSNINTENDCVICTECGQVFDHILDQGPEYRWFSGEDRNPDPTRVGAPQNPLLPESSLGTTMLLRKNHGNAMRKIKRYHTWNLMPYRERNLWGIFEGLHVRAVNAGIGLGVLEEAKRLYAQLSALCVCRGTQKEALIAACLYEGLKRSGTPRRPKDIATIFQINIRYVTKGLKQFANLSDLDDRLGTNDDVKSGKAIKAMKIKAESKPKDDTPAKTVSVESRRAKWDTVACSTTTYEHYIDPFVSKLDAPRHLAGTLISLTRQICFRADDMGICPENTPPSLTAAALTLACQNLKIQKTLPEIAAVCDISVVTLHKCLKRLDQWKKDLLSTEQNVLATE
jgi:transcription initiation factor TFIIB